MNTRPVLAHLSLVFLLMYAEFACSKVHYITPSPDGLCPQNSSCFTLSQFATDLRSNETDISLLFLPGNHTLDRELSLAQVNISMRKGGLHNETVFVECLTRLGRFHISDTIFVSVKDLHFIGCGNNIVSQVKWLTITRSTFQDVQDRHTVLVLNEVSNGTIVKSSFLSNSLHYPTTTVFFPLISGMLNYVYIQRSTPSGVLHTVCSNISVISSKFSHNKADIGGALVAHNSSLYLARSLYSNNTANFGGVMVTTRSTINMDNNTFTNNTALWSSGVTVTYNDTFTISSTTYTDNSAGYGGGVVTTFGNSSFDISNSTFTNNSAVYGAVMYTDGSSSFNISNSSFTKNSADGSGGVMFTSVDSSFDIRNSIFSKNSANVKGGVMYTSDSSSFNISNTSFTSNSAGYGGVISTNGHSSFDIRNSTFTINSADSIGGVMDIGVSSSFDIRNSSFTNNSAGYGGVMYTYGNSLLDISNTSFTNNSASSGGVMSTVGSSSFNIRHCTFTDSIADVSGGVMNIGGSSSFDISNSCFTRNSAGGGGVLFSNDRSLFDIRNSSFTNNSAAYGSVTYTYGSASFSIGHSSFTNNSAIYGGVVFATGDSSFDISDSIFSNNSADYGGVMYTSDTSLNVVSSNFVNNTATHCGGIIWCSKDGTLKVDNSNFSLNAVSNQGGGVIFIRQCSVHISKSTFDKNNGSLYTFNSNLTFSGYLKFENTTEPLITRNVIESQEGGAITSFQSTVIFSRKSMAHFSNNHASHGGAILATESSITIYGETTIANNMANNSGGGISLKQSRLEIKGKCHILKNNAMRGGGIHAYSSTIAVYQPGILHVINNRAGDLGGGIYLEVSPKVYILKNKETLLISYFMNFTGNHANFGGAMYVADDTNSGVCSPNVECFIQALALYKKYSYFLKTKNMFFSDNTASEQGPNLFGGLLDRCIPSPFAEVYQRQINYSGHGILYLQDITNSNLHSISSQPVRLCFCNSEHEPDCSYQPPTITVQKGETFNVSLVAVDQVNHTVDANVSSYLSSSHGGFGEGQQTQNVGKNCTNLTFNVFSPYKYETLNLYPNGPCESATLSTSHVTIQFTACTCPVGFEPLSNSKSSTRCECDCDSALSPYITKCNFASSSVLRTGINSWITYINGTDQHEYVIYPHCPFDYCHPQDVNISINFNIPNGADSQCAHNRMGVLCGACKDDLSLSLASSRCVPCHAHWPAVFVAILLAAAIAGILLVTALLALNMTVSVGLINGIIFYANIVSVGSAVFFSIVRAQLSFSLCSLG